jgi:hypothetical protein
MGYGVYLHYSELFRMNLLSNTLTLALRAHSPNGISSYAMSIGVVILFV